MEDNNELEGAKSSKNIFVAGVRHYTPNNREFVKERYCQGFFMHFL
jgi:hypothetical protein